MDDGVSMSLLCSSIICVALNFYLSNLLVLFFHGGPQVDWVVCDRNRRPWKGSLGLEGLEGLRPGCTAQVCRQTQTELQYMIETWCQSDFKTRHHYYTITEFSFRAFQNLQTSSLFWLINLHRQDVYKQAVLTELSSDGCIARNY